VCCGELGAVAGCLAVMQEPHQLSQWMTACELQGRNLIPIRDIGFFLFATSRRTRVACYRGLVSIECPMGQVSLRVQCLEIEDDRSHLCSDKRENL
jgi:hypothetical protein